MEPDETKSLAENLGYEFKSAWKGIGGEVSLYRMLALRSAISMTLKADERELHTVIASNFTD